MSQRQPTVSVVMPTLNQGAFIQQAIESVLDQDFSDTELVVVDGGSTDSTLAILQAALVRYGSRLRWVSERDSGPASAINKAVRLTRGDVIGWLNSDDLLAPGAIGRAVDYFRAHPQALMVYGEAQHVDVAGRFIGRYPTRPASAAIEEFHAGCFICQPTVFMARAFFEEVGYLDEGLRTAFDFDLWLRCFRNHRDRIGYISETQALSRLHDSGITLTQRRQVAIEGISLLARHVGPPEAHWFWTYLDELCANFPFVGRAPDLVSEVTDFFGVTSALFSRETRDRIRDALAQDARLKMSIPGAFAGVYPDGWAGPILVVRLRQPPPARCLVLSCIHATPATNPLHVRTRVNWSSEVIEVSVGTHGPFEIEIPLAGREKGERAIAIVRADTTFSPAKARAGNDDDRELAFRVESIRWR